MYKLDIFYYILKFAKLSPQDFGWINNIKIRDKTHTALGNDSDKE